MLAGEGSRIDIIGISGPSWMGFWNRQQLDIDLAQEGASLLQTVHSDSAPELR